jgi:Protein of unknown function (DUF5818)
MKRWTMLLPALTLISALAFAQQFPALKPAPGPNGVLGPQLIAWSEMQKPQPVPQRPEPLPPPDTQPGEQPSPEDKSPTSAQQQVEPETQQHTVQSITGTVVKVAGRYVLETGDNLAYQLDDQDKARQYEGKRVKVTGTLDRNTGVIHVTSIELLS